MTTPAIGGATCVCGGLGKRSEFQRWFALGVRSSSKSTVTNLRQRTASELAAVPRFRSNRMIPAVLPLVSGRQYSTLACLAGSR